MDDIRRHGENQELVKEVIDVSKKHRIASPYTSFLVLETEQAYDQHGVDRRSARWQPPSPTAQAPAPKASTLAKSAEETVDDEEFARKKDDSHDFLSDKPFKGKAMYDVIGGGRYGTRFSRGQRPPDTEKAVLDALRWLAKNQRENGSWDAPREDFRVGNTALSVLAFLGMPSCTLRSRKPCLNPSPSRSGSLR